MPLAQYGRSGSFERAVAVLRYLVDGFTFDGEKLTAGDIPNDKNSQIHA
jgi:hypothetical protein